MGVIGIFLQDENGKPLTQVNGDSHLLDSLLPEASNAPFHVLRIIDPYGDTVFNRLQMDEFLAEWDMLTERARSLEQREVLAEVRALASLCREQPHLYLKFCGD
jgi:hypothetical protein